jgi:hypothetical protein
MPVAAVDQRAWVAWNEAAPPDLLRRLDWRFLLDTHALGRVGYLGPASSTLSNALSVFSQTLQPLEDGRLRERAFDLIVAKGVGGDRVAVALPALAAGGSLYWELPMGRFPFTRAWSVLDRQDLDPLEFYWHYPSFDECRLIVPLNHPAALTWLLRRRFARVDPSVLLKAVSAIVHTGLLTRVLSSVSVVGRRPADEGSR